MNKISMEGRFSESYIYMGVQQRYGGQQGGYGGGEYQLLSLVST
jgi:hypothetical protein